MLNRKAQPVPAFQNSIDIVNPKSSHGEKVRPVRNQSAPCAKLLSKEIDSKLAWHRHMTGTARKAPKVHRFR